MDQNTVSVTEVAVDWDVSQPVSLVDLTGADGVSGAVQQPNGNDLARLRLTFPSGRIHEGTYRSVLALDTGLYGRASKVEPLYVNSFKLNYVPATDIDSLRALVARFEQDWGLADSSAAELDTYLNALEQRASDTASSDESAPEPVKGFEGRAHGAIATGLTIEATQSGYALYVSIKFNPVPVESIEWDLSKPLFLTDLKLTKISKRYFEESAGRKPIQAQVQLPGGTAIDLAVTGGELTFADTSVSPSGRPVDRVVLHLPETDRSDVSNLIETIDTACGLSAADRSALTEATSNSPSDSPANSGVSIPLTANTCGVAATVTINQISPAVELTLIIDVDPNAS